MQLEPPPQFLSPAAPMSDDEDWAAKAARLEPSAAALLASPESTATYKGSTTSGLDAVGISRRGWSDSGTLRGDAGPSSASHAASRSTLHSGLPVTPQQNTFTESPGVSPSMPRPTPRRFESKRLSFGPQDTFAMPEDGKAGGTAIHKLHASEPENQQITRRASFAQNIFIEGQPQAMHASPDRPQADTASTGPATPREPRSSAAIRTAPDEEDTLTSTRRRGRSSEHRVGSLGAHLRDFSRQSRLSTVGSIGTQGTRGTRATRDSFGAQGGVRSRLNQALRPRKVRGRQEEQAAAAARAASAAVKSAQRRSAGKFKSDAFQIGTSTGGTKWLGRSFDVGHHVEEMLFSRLTEPPEGNAAAEPLDTANTVDERKEALLAADTLASTLPASSGPSGKSEALAAMTEEAKASTRGNSASDEAARTSGPEPRSPIKKSISPSRAGASTGDASSTRSSLAPPKALRAGQMKADSPHRSRPSLWRTLRAQRRPQPSTLRIERAGKTLRL